MIRNPSRTFSPPTDVIELPDKLLVLVELAGMKPNDWNITLIERRLTISGMRVRPEHVNPAYHQVEIGFGSFSIEILVPWPVERDHVSASYESGFLQIELPRRAPKQITVIEK